MNKTADILEALRKERPLVHHITNWVTIYDCANIVRASGALPVMAHAKEEAAEMACLASALVLNIGTLTNEIVESMKIAGKEANKNNIPVILDAVGVGATPYRNEKSLEILEEIHVDIIKGNASEIARIGGIETMTKGVESTNVEEDLTVIAKKIAFSRKASVVITGKQDIVAGEKCFYLCKNGHPLMGSIVGTGCMAASLAGAFAAVEKDYARAAAAALSSFGVAGQIAALKSKGPGSFKENLYDCLYNLDRNSIEKLEKMEEYPYET